MPSQIIRPDAKGEPDDIAISDVSMFRLERMDRDRWWLAVYRGDERVAFAIRAKSKIVVEVTEDAFGCRDDSNDPV